MGRRPVRTWTQDSGGGREKGAGAGGAGGSWLEGGGCAGGCWDTGKECWLYVGGSGGGWLEGGGCDGCCWGTDEECWLFVGSAGGSSWEEERCAGCGWGAGRKCWWSGRCCSGACGPCCGRGSAVSEGELRSAFFASTKHCRQRLIPSSKAKSLPPMRRQMLQDSVSVAAAIATVYYTCDCSLSVTGRIE